MVTVQSGPYRVEAAAVPEPDGFCFVTAEVFDGRRMVRGYFRRLRMPQDGVEAAEWAVAEEVVRMAGESE